MPADRSLREAAARHGWLALGGGPPFVGLGGGVAVVAESFLSLLDDGVPGAVAYASFRLTARALEPRRGDLTMRRGRAAVHRRGRHRLTIAGGFEEGSYELWADSAELAASILDDETRAALAALTAPSWWLAIQSGVVRLQWAQDGSAAAVDGALRAIAAVCGARPPLAEPLPDLAARHHLLPVAGAEARFAGSAHGVALTLRIDAGRRAAEAGPIAIELTLEATGSSLTGTFSLLPSTGAPHPQLGLPVQGDAPPSLLRPAAVDALARIARRPFEVRALPGSMAITWAAAPDHPAALAAAIDLVTALVRPDEAAYR